MLAETISSRVRGCLHSHLWLDGHSELDHLFPFRTQKLSSSALDLVLSCASRRETPSLSTTPFLASRSRRAPGCVIGHRAVLFPRRIGALPSSLSRSGIDPWRSPATAPTAT